MCPRRRIGVSTTQGRTAGRAAGGRVLFFLLASASLALLLSLLWLLFFLLEPRVAALGGGLLAASRVLVVLAGAAAVFVVASDFLSAGLGVRLIPGRAGETVALHVLLPVSERLGMLAGVSRDRVRAGFIDFNNSLLRASLGADAEKADAVPPTAGVLVLLPRCLQSSGCARALGEDVSNCGECGSCAMRELKELVLRYRVRNRIVSGGTLALMAVRELGPRAVVGVACEGELLAAIRELGRVPVMAIPNSRPEGPCRNTRVEVALVEEALRILLKRSGSDCTID